MKTTAFARAILSVVAVTLAACGGTSNNVTTPPPVTVFSVAITCSLTSITTAQSSNCTGTVTYSNGTTSNKVSYALASGSVGSVTGAGVYSSASAGTGNVVATSTENTSVSSAPFAVTVTTVPVTVSSVAITCSLTSITTAQSSNCTGTVTYSNGTTSNKVSYALASGSVGSVTGAGVYSSASAGTGNVVATSTENTSVSSAPFAVTVTTVPVTVSSVAITCSLTSITTAQSSNCTGTVTYSNGTTSNKVSYALASGSVGSVTGAGVYSSASAGTGNVVATSTENTSVSSAPFAVTVTAGQIQLTSISPRAQLCNGECAFVTITLHGANIPSNIDVGDVSCTPNSNVQAVQWVNSTEVIVTLGIDATHEGSGDRLCQITNGTSTSAAVPFGFYSSNMCVTDPTSGEKFCLDPQEAIAGKTGYVDKFNASGAADGNFFVGSGSCCIAFDAVTKVVVVDGVPYDENGGQGDVPILVGEYTNVQTANAAGVGAMCLSTPSASLNLSCVLLSGSSHAFSHVSVPNLGAITIGKASNGDAIVYGVTVGATPTIVSADITTGMQTVNSKSVAGITTGAPGGSAIVVFDSLGLGVAVSYGDNLAVIFSETSLMETTSATLPGIPVNLVADTADGLALIGDANATSPGGTFTTVNPSNGTAAAIPSESTTILPTGLSVNPAGGSFSVCPFWLNGSTLPCNSFSIP